MDRYWLLTWTTYGTWLPGDARGFVSNVRSGPGAEIRHNLPGMPFDANDERVRTRAQQNLIGEPVLLTLAQAQILAIQLHETAKFRRWQLLALAVMRNHVHLVIGAPATPTRRGFTATSRVTRHGRYPARASGPPARDGGRNPDRDENTQMQVQYRPHARTLASSRVH
jgi:REP element-mobilizing transposase RayT